MRDALQLKLSYERASVACVLIITHVLCDSKHAYSRQAVLSNAVEERVPFIHFFGLHTLDSSRLALRCCHISFEPYGIAPCNTLGAKHGGDGRSLCCFRGRGPERYRDRLGRSVMVTWTSHNECLLLVLR